MRVETRRGLQKLLTKYEQAGADAYWISVIKGCIRDDLAMDETDYENTPKELRKLWRGLR